jgi:cathepsin L
MFEYLKIFVYIFSSCIVGGEWCPCGQAGNVSATYNLIWSEKLDHQIDSEESYPSTGLCTHKCSFKKSGVVTSFNAYVSNDKPNKEQNLYTLLKSGPVTVEVRADTISFQTYTAGILDDPNCSGDVLNHVLLLVGYGTENGEDYWIARNRL